MNNIAAAIQALVQMNPTDQIFSDTGRGIRLIEQAARLTNDSNLLYPVQRRISEAHNKLRLSGKNIRNPHHLQAAGTLHTAWYEHFKTDLLSERELSVFSPPVPLNPFVIDDPSNKPDQLPRFSIFNLYQIPAMAYEMIDEIRSSKSAEFTMRDGLDRIQIVVKRIEDELKGSPADRSLLEKNLKLLKGARRLIYAGIVPLRPLAMFLPNWSMVTVKILGKKDLPYLDPFLHWVESEDYMAMEQFGLHGSGGEMLAAADWFQKKTENFPLFTAGIDPHTDILSTISPDAAGQIGRSLIATHPAYAYPGVVKEVIRTMLGFAESQFSTIKASVHESRVAVLAAYHDVTYRSLKFRHTRTIAGHSEFVFHF